MELLHKRGFLIVRLPPEVIASIDNVSRCMRKFFSGSIAAKDKYRTPQDGEVVLSHPAYLTPSPGWNELFEVRRSCCDPSYRFPPGCEAPCCALFDQLRELSMRWLEMISSFLCGDELFLPSLARGDTGPASMRVIHYDQVVELHQQLKMIPRGTPQHREACRTLMAGFPTHTDSSLVTLAPRASLSGLAVRDYATSKWLRVERQMAHDEAVLFCGDALAFCSRHYFPACMHRPDGLEMCRAAPATRIATPLFLYADEDATLDASRVRPALLEQAQHAGEPLVAPSPLKLPTRHFRLNLNRCRETWPWKRSPYYHGLVLCRDSDHFPGRDLEGDMVYADEGEDGADSLECHKALLPRASLT